MIYSKSIGELCLITKLQFNCTTIRFPLTWLLRAAYSILTTRSFAAAVAHVWVLLIDEHETFQILLIPTGICLAFPALWLLTSHAGWSWVAVAVSVLLQEFKMDGGTVCRSCGKVFAQVNALSNYLHFCKTNQNRLHQALADARWVWAEDQNARKWLKLTHSNDSDQGLRNSIMVESQNEDLVVSEVVEKIIVKLTWWNHRGLQKLNPNKVENPLFQSLLVQETKAGY